MSVPDPSERTTSWRVYLLVACLAVVPFLPTLTNGLVWDDHLLIVGNPDLERPWSAVTRMHASGSHRTPYYRPLPTLFWSAQRRLFGDRPAGYHLTSVLLHALVTTLVLVLARSCLPAAAAAAAAGLFAVHPVHVEPVAFASLGAVDLLSSALLLLAASLLLARGGRPAADAPPARLWLSAGLFFLALCTKESALSFPILAAGLLAIAGPRPWRKIAAGLAPFFFALLAYGALRAWVAQRAQAASLTELVAPAPWMLPAWAAASLRWLVFPVPLLPYHELDPLTPAQAALLAGLAIVLALCVRSLLRRGRGGLAALAVGLLVVPLLPSAPLVPRAGALMAERFLYLPSAGVALLVAGLLEPLLARPRPGARPLAAAGAALLLAIGAWTFAASRDWRDDVTLFSRAAARRPGSVGLNFLLGDALFEEGRYAHAEAPLLRALAINPGFVKARVRLADVYRVTGRAAEARAMYRGALDAEPRSAEAHFGLGSLEMAHGAPADAARELETALRLNPALASARVNLGLLAFKAGDLAGAEGHWRRALELQPRNAQVLNNLGVVARRQGLTVEARRLFEKALEADPGNADARRNLSNLGTLPPAAP